MDKTPKLVEDWILKAEHDLGMALLANAYKAAIEIKAFILPMI